MLSTPEPPAAEGGEPARCSRRDCRAPARWILAWNNPKLHPPERRKTWLACDEHRDYLTDFLARRGFLRETALLEKHEKHEKPEEHDG